MLDLIIRSGRVATTADIFDADVAVKDGVIVALGLERDGYTLAHAPDSHATMTIGIPAWIRLYRLNH